MSEQVELAEAVWSEPALAELLGMRKAQLRRLRQSANFPLRRVCKGMYVALASDVLAWVKSQPLAIGEGADATRAETSASEQ